MNKIVTIKLDAVVDNPNLPVVETMQQFTLDAIAASGNNNMTDAQKWALNHFFYQIGAIGNDGIFAKTKYLFLPMICNKTLEKALVNYKNNTVFTISSSITSYLSFNEDGCILSSSRKQTVINPNETSDSSDLFYANSFQIISAGTAGAFRTADSQAYAMSQTDTVYQVAMQGIIHQYLKASVSTPCGAVMTTYNNEYSSILVGATQDYNIPYETSGTENKPSAPFSLRVQFDVVPVGMMMWGSHLTSQEMTTLAKAIRELMADYFAS